MVFCQKAWAPGYLFSLSDDQFDGWVIFTLCSVLLDHSSKGVLEQFKEHVAQVRGHIHELQILLAVQMYLGSSEETIVVFADEFSIIDSLLRHVSQVCFGADDAHIIFA